MASHQGGQLLPWEDKPTRDRAKNLPSNLPLPAHFVPINKDAAHCALANEKPFPGCKTISLLIMTGQWSSSTWRRWSRDNRNSERACVWSDRRQTSEHLPESHFRILWVQQQHIPPYRTIAQISTPMIGWLACIWAAACISAGVYLAGMNLATCQTPLNGINLCYRWEEVKLPVLDLRHLRMRSKANNVLGNQCPRGPMS